MKKLIFSTAIAIAVIGCNSPHQPAQQDILLTDKIDICESILPYQGKLLVGNFGTSVLDPLNTDGKGYILEFTDTTSRVLIPPDGNLSAPKGLLVKDDYLFIADVGKLVVYNLRDSTFVPKTVPFPQGELFVNDMALHGNTLYVTVTNTGSLYALDVNHPERVDSTGLKFFIKIPGANGIVIRGDSMFVASYPADGVTTADNVIYYIENISTPVVAKLFDRAGQYDGLALSADGERLYFSNWEGPEVGYYDMKTRKVELLDTEVELDGPARIWLDNGTLYIPDMPNSRVVKMSL